MADREQSYATPRYTSAAVFDVEGSRVAIMTCLRCGAAILCDPRDPLDVCAIHTRWHAALALRATAPKETT